MDTSSLAFARSSIVGMPSGDAIESIVVEGCVHSNSKRDGSDDVVEVFTGDDVLHCRELGVHREAHPVVVENSG